MALRKQEPLLRSYGDTLVRSVKSRISTGESVFDAVKLYNFTTFDIMADLAFGQPFHLIENAEYTPWVKLVFGATKAVSIIRILAYFPPLQDVLLALVPKSTRDAKEEYFRFAAELVDRRLANERTAPDIWNLVLTQEATKQMSLEEMHSNAVLFMVPGTDTTATLLSGLTYLLLKHPHYMTRVTEEVRGGFADEEDIKMEALARLPFLNACIEEALRLYPASPGGVPRQAPKGGTVVCGKFVPGGVSLLKEVMTPANFNRLVCTFHRMSASVRRRTSRSQTITDRSVGLESPNLQLITGLRCSLSPLGHGTASVRIWHTMRFAFYLPSSFGILTLSLSTIGIGWTSWYGPHGRRRH